MKVRTLRWCALTMMSVAGMSCAAWAQANQPSQLVLADMGLDGLVVMSDDDALSIRGFGYGGSSAEAYGHSWANVSTKHGSAGSENGYDADGRHFAKGSNHSYAGFEIEIEHSKGGRKNGHGGMKGRKGGKGGDKGGKWGGKGGGKGGKWGGKGGGYHGGSKEISFKVFAGGGSWAKAH